MNRKQIVRLIGNLLMIVALVFIAVKLIQYREAIVGVITWKIGWIMLVSAVLTAGEVIVAGIMYGRLLEAIAGIRIHDSIVVPIYCKSNLNKYIPGNVLQYVGRNQIAEMSAVRHDQVLFASLFEMGFMVVGALIVAFSLAREYVINWFRNSDVTLILRIAVAVVLLGIVVILILKKKKSKILNGFKSLLKRENIVFMLLFLLVIIFNQILNGALFVWLLRQLAVDLPRGYWNNIAGVYCFAWLVGFITPGAPGGMGIREALLVMLLGNVVKPEMITAAIVLNRIVTTFSDVIAYFASKLFARKTED